MFFNVPEMLPIIFVMVFYNMRFNTYSNKIMKFNLWNSSLGIPYWDLVKFLE